MWQLIRKGESLLFRKKTSWVLASVFIWLTIAGIAGGVMVYMWAAMNGQQLEQVYQLREELDSISDRGYLLQHKIDSLNRLGVADIDFLEDTASAHSGYKQLR